MSAQEQAGAALRDGIGALYSAWNAAVDRQQADALARLCVDGVLIADPASGVGAGSDIAGYLAGAAQWGGRQQRQWCHLRIQPDGDGFACEAFAMLLVAWPTGSSAIAWCGYSRDRVVAVDGGYRFATRSFATWAGEPLARFPRYQPVD